MNRARLAGLVALTLSAALVPDRAAAQSVRYLPLTSWAEPLVDYLQRAGVLRGLDPLTRPLRRADIARALAEVDTVALAPSLRRMARLLAREVADPPGPVAWTIEPHAGVLGASDASRWTLRPTADSAAAFPQIGIDAALDLPHVSLVATPALDNRLRGDPWYHGKKDRFMAGRATDTYVAGNWRYAEVFFGATNRNWGPTELEGLLVSPSPYSSEHFLLRVGPERLRLELLAQQLDTITPWDSTPAPDRWLVSHRLVVAPSRRLSFSLEESVIATGASIPWRYLNPATLGLLTQLDNGSSANAMLGLSASWLARGATRLFGQLLIDDIQVDHNAQGDKEPTAWGLTLGGSGPLAGGRATWTGYYTRVANLTYRTPNNEEQYTADGVGIARNQSDYDQLTARLEAAAPGALLLGAEANLVRQGQGDMRLQYPPIAAFADSLAFLTGTVQRTVQVAATARWTPRPEASVYAYLGYATYDNAGHVAGASDSRVIWRLQVTLRRRFAGAVSEPAS